MCRLESPRRDGTRAMMIDTTRALIVVGICLVPIVIIGVFGFAAVLRRGRPASAMSFAAAPSIRLGELLLEREGQLYEVGFRWVNGTFVAEDGQPLMPTAIADLDAQGRVRWGSEQQRAWFRQRFVDNTAAPVR